MNANKNEQLNVEAEVDELEAALNSFKQDKQASGKTKIVVSAEDVEYANKVLKHLNNVKSHAIEFLLKQGWQQGRIARSLKVIPQFVSNINTKMKNKQ